MTFKDLRRRSCLEVTEAANALKISVHTIYKIEEGTRKPSIKLVKRMCDIYKVTIEELFNLL